MTAKRKAAADLFVEQNIVPQAAAAEELVDAQQQVRAPLAASATLAVPSPPAPQSRGRGPRESFVAFKTSEELQIEKEPIHVREVGTWPFKRVIVPPNVYVVHTRLGHKEPVTIGQGLSFRYNPYTDAYLVVPAAMQTIGIIANSISREKQGINVLAYVQWQINDFAIAYRKLDFSDQRDPLGIVNAQLREQAEAAIKDKIATMSIEEVLTDKEPIIEELTDRLKTVAEGRTSSGEAADEGLGIKIVTVQIKEAYVSSQRLWENLQAPFRHLQDKNAQVSRLQAQDEIRQMELKNRKSAETGEAEAMLEIERTKQSTQTEALSVRLAEEHTRLVKEQESAQQRIGLEEQTARVRQESEQRLVLEAARAEQERKLAELRRVQEEAVERARLDAEAGARRKVLEVEQALKEMTEETRLAENRLEAERLRIERETTLKKLDAELALLVHGQDALLAQRAQEAALARTRQERLAQLEMEETANRVQLELEEKQVGIARLQQEVENLVNEHSLKDRLIEKLPELAAHMPEVQELKVLQTGPSDGAFDTLTAFLARLLALAESLGLGQTKGPAAEADGSQSAAA